jgi:hypothetical protein
VVPEPAAVLPALLGLLVLLPVVRRLVASAR